MKNKSINLYGNGDIKQVNVSREMEIDFESAYGVPFENHLHGEFSNKRIFDSELERLRYERGILVPLENEIMDRNPEMYPPKRLR